jgi:hypothetical protein
MGFYKVNYLDYELNYSSESSESDNALAEE